MATVIDSFNRSDNADPNAASTGKSPDFSWTEIAGGWSISGNLLAVALNGSPVNAFIRAETDLATDDNYGQVKQPNQPSQNYGPVCRMDAAASTGYVFIWRHTNLRYELFKVEAGVLAFLAAGGSTRAANDVLKVEAIGTAIKGYRNGVLNASVANGDIATGKRAGIFALDTAQCFFDDFEMGDATASGTKLLLRLQTDGLFVGV
jgi:hypothetical protein